MLVGLLLVVAVLGGIAWRSRGSGPEKDAQDSPPAAVRSRSVTTTDLSASVSSFDPSGGSGFRRKDKVWKTQTYTSPDFGNLKSGVGLMLDLGEKRDLSSVAVSVASGPLTVELRAGDTPGALSSLDRVGDPTTVSGSAELPAAQGGRHRYWLVWVTRLAPTGGGYQAVIRQVVPRGTQERP